MHARMTEAKHRDHLCQSADATEPSETRATPAATDALRIGLAHFIHELNTPPQQVYWTACMLDTLAPKANLGGARFVGKMFQKLTFQVLA